MRARIALGRVLGIHVRLHVSWFVVLALVGAGAYEGFSAAYPLQRRGWLAAMAATASILFFASLLAHELAHAVLARRLGVHVRGITLFLFGGVSEISAEVRSARDEFAIALAGPGVSVFLGGVFALVSSAGTSGGSQPVEGVAAALAGVNGMLALFNLVPGLPLDGGRLLRAGIWRLTGSHARSTRIAVAAGRLVALALLLTGAVRIVGGDVFGAWLVLIALFLDTAARASGRTAAAVTLDRDEGSTPKPRP